MTQENVNQPYFLIYSETPEHLSALTKPESSTQATTTDRQSSRPGWSNSILSVLDANLPTRTLQDLKKHVLISWHRKADHNYKGLRPLLFSLLSTPETFWKSFRIAQHHAPSPYWNASPYDENDQRRKQRNNGPNSLQQTRFSTHIIPP